MVIGLAGPRVCGCTAQHAWPLRIVLACLPLQVPRYWKFVDSFPLTISGKPQASCQTLPAMLAWMKLRSCRQSAHPIRLPVLACLFLALRHATCPGRSLVAACCAEVQNARAGHHRAWLGGWRPALSVCAQTVCHGVCHAIEQRKIDTPQTIATLCPSTPL